MSPPSKWILRYSGPALDWEKQALPLGNGRLGVMCLGSPGATWLELNVDSLWTGGENPNGTYDDEEFGNYQPLGAVCVELVGLGRVRDYRRTLDLATALYEVAFSAMDGTQVRQQAFASHPAQVIAFRVSAKGPGCLTGRVRLSGAHGEHTSLAAAKQRAAELRFSGALPNGLKYEARALVLTEGCAPAQKPGAIGFRDCSTVTVFVAAATTYALEPSRGWRSPVLHPDPARSLELALELGFDQLYQQHLADYQALFSRVDVDFGASPAQVRNQPLNVRIDNYRPGRDPALTALLFQYGRYLLIASSRPGDLPANLQGIWNREHTPPWHSDYHTNINTQMNYWLAEPANLSECHLPLFDLLDAMVPACREATRSAFGGDVPGFTYRTSHNIFGGQGWEWNTTANAWYALHYFEHAAFTRDREFLRERAWPHLKEASCFWLHRLEPTADGKLVAPDGWSPEHGPRESGVAYDQQLIWELFDRTLEASAMLNVTDAIVPRVAAAKDRLLGPQIGRWGQLQEWMSDRDDPNDRHRHTSHLLAVYPGRRINPRQTPKWADAAAVSLRARGDTGDSRRSWTWPWRCALWARLGKGDAHRMIDGLIRHNLLHNLLTTHPPLQLDGNFGITAAICEMLLQSHTGEIALLPAVDFERCPDGFFRGLRARGGFELAARWQAGRLVDAELAALAGGIATLRSTPTCTRVVADDGQAVPFHATPDGCIQLHTTEGKRYRLLFY